MRAIIARESCLQQVQEIEGKLKIDYNLDTVSS